MRTPLRHGWLIGLVLLAAGSPARADVSPPDELSCRTQSEGAGCTVDYVSKQRGTCQKATCSRNNYAGWNRDAGSVPPTAHYDCLRCVPKDGGTEEDAGSARADAGTRERDDPEEDDGHDGGCALGTRSELSAGLGSLALAACFGLLLRRRRTR